MINEKIDRQCIFCRSSDVYEMVQNNVHRFHIGYNCWKCDCVWNDETEKAVTAGRPSTHVEW